MAAQSKEVVTVPHRSRCEQLRTDAARSSSTGPRGAPAPCFQRLPIAPAAAALCGPPLRGAFRGSGPARPGRRAAWCPGAPAAALAQLPLDGTRLGGHQPGTSRDRTCPVPSPPLRTSGSAGAPPDLAGLIRSRGSSLWRCAQDSSSPWAGTAPVAGAVEARPDWTEKGSGTKRPAVSWAGPDRRGRAGAADGDLDGPDRARRPPCERVSSRAREIGVGTRPRCLPERTSRRRAAAGHVHRGLSDAVPLTRRGRSSPWRVSSREARRHQRSPPKITGAGQEECRRARVRRPISSRRRSGLVRTSRARRRQVVERLRGAAHLVGTPPGGYRRAAPPDSQTEKSKVGVEEGPDVLRAESRSGSVARSRRTTLALRDTTPLGLRWSPRCSDVGGVHRRGPAGTPALPVAPQAGARSGL